MMSIFVGTKAIPVPPKIGQNHYLKHPRKISTYHSWKGFPWCITTPALAVGPSESIAPTLGWPFFLDRVRAGEVEKRAEREGRIEEEEFWSKEDGEKLGTKLLEMEAKRPAISATTIDMFTKFHHKYLTSILEDPCHQITEFHKCNQPSHKANPLTKLWGSTVQK